MILRFANYEVDGRVFELRKDGRPVRVQRRVLDLIIFLLQRRERVVSRAELIAGPWGGTCVSDAALNQAIRSARRVLEDEAQNPTVILTVRGRGFRFGAAVEQQTTRDVPRSSPRDHRELTNCSNFGACVCS